MSQTDDTTPLSDETAWSATFWNALPEGRPVLLGTYIKPEGGTWALLRTRQGDMRRVRLGDRIGQTRITNIESGAIDLTLLGTTHRLSIPGRA